MIEIKLRENLAKKNKTMADLNKETGISKNALSQLANGVSKGIQFNTLEKILDNLEVPIQDLIVYTPNYTSDANIYFSYDNKTVLDVSYSSSLGGTCEEDAFEYTDKINLIIPSFIISVDIEDINLNVTTYLDVNFVINQKKELDTLEINIKIPSYTKKILSTPLLTDELMNQLSEYLGELAESLFSEDIDDFDFSYVYFDGDLY